MKIPKQLCDVLLLVDSVGKERVFRLLSWSSVTSQSPTYIPAYCWPNLSFTYSGKLFSFRIFSGILRKYRNWYRNCLFYGLDFIPSSSSKRHINNKILPWYENFNFTFPSKDILCIPSHKRAMTSLKNFNSSCFVDVIIEGMNLILFKISLHFVVNDCREKDWKHSKTRSNPLWKKMKPCWN